MTNKEAYKWLYTHFAPCGDETKQDEAVNVALKALRKQIPKKATDGESCPNCGKDMWIKDYKFCPTCGQRIDWTEGER